MCWNSAVIAGGSEGRALAGMWMFSILKPSLHSLLPMTLLWPDSAKNYSCFANKQSMIFYLTAFILQSKLPTGGNLILRSNCRILLLNCLSRSYRAGSRKVNCWTWSRETSMPFILSLRLAANSVKKCHLRLWRDDRNYIVLSSPCKIQRSCLWWKPKAYCS